MKDILVLK